MEQMYLTPIQQELISELNTRFPWRVQPVSSEAMEMLSGSPTACGYFSKVEGRLIWCPKNRPSHANTILFHELAHATIDSTGRSCSGVGTDYDREEVLAEAIGRALCRRFGLECAEAERLSQDYIDGYARSLTDDDYRWIQHHLPLALNHIITKWIPDFNAKYSKVKVAA